MTNRIHAACIASLGLVVLMFAGSDASAQSRTSPRAAFASIHSTSHRSTAQSLRHFRRRNIGAFWPGDGYDGPSTGEPAEYVTPPTSGDVHYTTTYDVPWDWAHRFPPNVAPSDRPYVPSCPTETVTVPGRNGQQTVNVTRCF
jgi:hypothetical protein